jgi:NAD(P)-dependent dehydrogenase (short-subunit alcohol dehydrogenase family)
MGKVAQSVGTWDVLVLNAGYISTPAPIAKAPLEDYFQNYEARSTKVDSTVITDRSQTNVKSIVVAATTLLPKANPVRAVVLAVTAGAICFPTKQVIGLSGYLVSKLAQIKTIEFLAAENPNIFACSVHPGMIETKMFLKSGATPDMLPMDTGE